MSDLQASCCNTVWVAYELPDPVIFLWNTMQNKGAEWKAYIWLLVWQWNTSSIVRLLWFVALEEKKKERAVIKITVKYTACLSPSIYSADIFSMFGNMIIHWWARLAIYWKTDDWHLASNMDNSYTHWTACTNLIGNLTWCWCLCNDSKR